MVVVKAAAKVVQSDCRRAALLAVAMEMRTVALMALRWAELKELQLAAVTVDDLAARLEHATAATTAATTAESSAERLAPPSVGSTAEMMDLMWAESWAVLTADRRVAL